MRDELESPAAWAALPNHRPQYHHHQATMMGEQKSNPRHPSATPAWYTHTIVANDHHPEPDRSSGDSGLSPDYCSSSASASPEFLPNNPTATSLEPYAEQMPNYASLPGLYPDTVTPMDLAADSALRQTGAAGTKQEPHAASVDDDDDDDDNCPISQDNATQVQHEYSCHVCQFKGTNIEQMNRHLRSHYESEKDLEVSVDTASPSKTVSSNAEQSSTAELSEIGESLKDTPISTSKEKNRGRGTKVWACKKCKVHFSSRTEYWDHRRVHVRPEKQLHCPECQFVTPFKHHLEYHISNHYGIKPFECEQCEYSCVSKSMLNSHLKSHSSIYQFHCAGCPYRTKYCHSFKLHLRKLGHHPGLVLHPDGTPNPDFVLDINGTRRGPKRKSIPGGAEPAGPAKALPPASVTSEAIAGVSSVVLTPQASPADTYVSDPSASARENHVKSPVTAEETPGPSKHAFPLAPLPLPHISSFIGPNGIHPIMTYRFDQVVNSGFPLLSYGIASEAQFDHFKSCILAECSRALALDSPKASNEPVNLIENISMVKSEEKLEEIVHEAPPATPRPLDLSRSDEHRAKTPEHTSTMAIVESPKTSGTSRRKGKAVKLVRPVKMEPDEADDVEPHEDELDVPGAAGSPDFGCKFCGIAFDNEIMFRLHMGQHGHDDPFQCNQCGHKCQDKLSFFVHITHAKH